MAKTPTKITKGKKKTDAKDVAKEPRMLKKPQYRSFRLHKRIKGESLPSAFSVFKTSLTMLARHWRVFAIVALVYGVINAVLVQGLQLDTGSATEAKSLLDELYSDSWGRVFSGLSVFAFLLESSGSTTTPVAGTYQLMLMLVVSLATIWLLRQVYAGNTVRVRDGFYRGMTPLVTFLLVLIVVTLQLIPLAAGWSLYSMAVSSGIAVNAIEEVLWALIAFLLSVLSLYMVTSSIFALYIVTLPDMTPMRALRSARQLVAHRRWSVMRKVLFLPLALGVLIAVIVLPFVFFATSLAMWVVLLLTTFLIPVVHSYMYALYREML